MGRRKDVKDFQKLMEYLGTPLDDKPKSSDYRKARERAEQDVNFLFMTEKKQNKVIKKMAKEEAISRILKKEGITGKDLNRVLDYGYTMVHTFPQADEEDRIIMAGEILSVMGDWQKDLLESFIPETRIPVTVIQPGQEDQVMGEPVNLVQFYQQALLMGD